MDYAFYSAIVSGLIFLIVIKMAFRIFLIEKSVMQIEEIIVGFNNIIADAVKVFSPEEFNEMVQEEINLQTNKDAIEEWDNS